MMPISQKLWFWLSLVCSLTFNFHSLNQEGRIFCNLMSDTMSEIRTQERSRFKKPSTMAPSHYGWALPAPAANGWFNLACLYSTGALQGKFKSTGSRGSLGSNPGSVTWKLCSIGQVNEPIWIWCHRTVVPASQADVRIKWNHVHYWPLVEHWCIGSALQILALRSRGWKRNLKGNASEAMCISKTLVQSNGNNPKLEVCRTGFSSRFYMIF